MYWQAETKRKMEVDNLCVVSRVGNYPVVASALSQVTSIYGRAKERNTLVKYTLESAESVTKKVTDTALPIVTNKFEGKLNSLNTIACSQLDKLEGKYPIITKPTEEVLEETKKVYENTLKPTVDRVSAATQYSIDTVGGVKTYACDKVKDVKDYTYTTVNNVKDYGIGKAVIARDFGVLKVGEALQTPYGQKVAVRLDGAMDVVEDYIDHYLPAEGEEEKKDEEKLDTLAHVVALTSKVQRRVYKRAINDLTNIEMRSKETLNKLNFTVDLIQYARTNIDNAQETMNTGMEKIHDIWEEINREETVEETKFLETKDKTLERQMIRTARHLTLQLKQGLKIGTESANALPEMIATKLEQTRKYSEELYNSFAKITNYSDLSNQFMENVHSQMTNIQQMLGSLTDTVVGMWPINRLAGSLDGKSDKADLNKPAEVEMKTMA